jgi:hypothetical protein
MQRLRRLHEQLAARPAAAAEGGVPAIWGHSPGKVQQAQERAAARPGDAEATRDAAGVAPAVDAERWGWTAEGAPAGPAQAPTAMEEFEFDLNGFVVLRSALGRAEVDAINAALDALPEMRLGDWLGYAHVTAGPGDISLQQLYELGPAFERLIDHPAYFEKLRRFIGGSGWDNQHNGLLTIDEAFANFRATGGGIPMHGSGGANGTRESPGSMKSQYRFANGVFLSGQINMALALSDVGPGDGATMLLPGSHKANLGRPAEMQPADPKTMEGVPGAVEVHLAKGDVLLFVDSVMHGGARKTTPGVRRSIWYRYTTAWSRLRYGYHPSRALCERLTPRRAAIVDPQYARMLERAPQAEPARRFPRGEAWSASYLHETRVQQKEATAGLTRPRRLALQERWAAGGALAEAEAEALAAFEAFDATSH